MVGLVQSKFGQLGKFVRRASQPDVALVRTSGTPRPRVHVSNGILPRALPVLCMHRSSHAMLD